MLDAMLDNWELSSCVLLKAEKDEMPAGCFMSPDEVKVCWQSFLSSIVLWDNLYFNTEDMGSISLLPLGLRYIVNCIRENKISFIHPVSYYRINVNSEKIDNLVSTIINKAKHMPHDMYDGYEFARSILYYSVSQVLGYTYIAAPRREIILSDLFLKNEKLDPTLFMDLIDKKIQNKINEINVLCGRNIISFRVPVLYNYIQKKAIGRDEELQYAIELHDRKDVVCFRKSVRTVNRLLRSGDILQVEAAIQETNHLCEQLSDSMYKKQLTYGINVGLSPSLSFDRQSKAKVKSLLHTTFIRDVAHAAFEGR